MIQNYIRIDGKYVKQQDVPPEKMKEISKELAIKLAAGFGYEPVKKKQSK